MKINIKKIICAGIFLAAFFSITNQTYAGPMPQGHLSSSEWQNLLDGSNTNTTVALTGLIKNAKTSTSTDIEDYKLGKGGFSLKPGSGTFIINGLEVTINLYCSDGCQGHIKRIQEEALAYAQTQFIGGGTIKPNPDCANSFYLISVSCPANTHLSGNSCISNDIACPEGQTLIDNACVNSNPDLATCSTGQHFDISTQTCVNNDTNLTCSTPNTCEGSVFVNQCTGFRTTCTNGCSVTSGVAQCNGNTNDGNGTGDGTGNGNGNGNGNGSGSKGASGVIFLANPGFAKGGICHLEYKVGNVNTCIITGIAGASTAVGVDSVTHIASSTADIAATSTTVFRLTCDALDGSTMSTSTRCSGIPRYVER